MQTASPFEIVARWPLAGGLPAEFLQRLAAEVRSVELAAGEVLFREGSQNADLFVIGSGTLALDMHVPGRGPTRILTLGPGELVAWSAILGDGRMTTSALAIEPAHLVAIPAERLLELCRSEPALGYQFMRAMAQAVSRRLVATRLQLLDLFSNSGPGSNNP